MDSSALLKPNVTQELVSTIVRSMIFAAYADVVEVQKDGSLTVKGCVSDGLAPFITTVRVVYPTTSQVQVMFKPEKGDKVLVVGLQSYNEDMFTSTSPIRDIDGNDVQHYTILGCVAVPLNIENSEVPLRISDGDFKAGTKDVHGITINEGDDPVVRWSELKALLSDWFGALDNHTHPVSGSTAGKSTSFETLYAKLTQDLNNTASEVLAVPKKGV